LEHGIDDVLRCHETLRTFETSRGYVATLMLRDDGLTFQCLFARKRSPSQPSGQLDPQSLEVRDGTPGFRTSSTP
jgi:hypothetical protein